MFLRIGSAETDDQLKAALAKFLTPVLLKLASQADGVRKKVGNFPNLIPLCFTWYQLVRLFCYMKNKQDIIVRVFIVSCFVEMSVNETDS